MNSLNEKKIFDVYGKMNIWKLGLNVIIPSLLLTLLFGIYIFVDQMIIINLVPNDGHNYLLNWFTSQNQADLYNRVSDYIAQNPNENLVVSNNIHGFIVYPTSNLIGPFSLIILSFGYFISAGSAVIFSKALATKDYQLKDKVLWNSFYATIAFSVVATIIMVLIQNSVLNLMVSKTHTVTTVIGNNSEGVTAADLNNYLTLWYNGTIDLANQYIYWMNGAILFSCLSNLFVFFIRAEGYNLWITLIGIFANIANIIFDVILIVVLKKGIMGGGIATFLGQFLNCFGLLVYLVILNHKDKTFIKFRSLFKIKDCFSAKIIFDSFLLGSSTFLRKLSSAVANIVYVPVFMATMQAISPVALNSYSQLAPTPIYNLFYFAIFGIIDGMRPIISYNYSQKNYKRVKEGFWIGIFTAIVYSFIVISLVFSIVPNNNAILKSLNANSDYDKQNLFYLMLSQMWQFPFLALSVGGLALFQSTNKKTWNIIASLTPGVFCFYPIIFIMSSIAIQTNAVTVMVFTGFTNNVVSSFVLLAYSIYFIALFSNKKLQDFNNKIVKFFQFNKKTKYKTIQIK
ncbi:MAG: hypothetical protein HUJ42_03040 [Malacoplasma sp.]|nr:hypothetical protein [Malacoplasma sp.]